jgi:hypothetical protein
MAKKTKKRKMSVSDVYDTDWSFGAAPAKAVAVASVAKSKRKLKGCHWEMLPSGACVGVRRTGYGKPKRCSAPSGPNPCAARAAKVSPVGKKVVKRKRPIRGGSGYVAAGPAAPMPKAKKGAAKKGGSKATRCTWKKIKGGRCVGQKTLASGAKLFCKNPQGAKPKGCKGAKKSAKRGKKR